MNVAERYYLTDHLVKAIAREQKNVENMRAELNRANAPDSPYAESRRLAVHEHRGMVRGLQEALSIVRGLS